MKFFSTMKALTLMVSMMTIGSQAIQAKLVKPSGGSLSGNLVISKVFYAGCKTLAETPKNYTLNLYIELYNNSSDTLNLQGLYLALANTDNGNSAWTAAAMDEEHKDSAVVKQIFQLSADEEYRLDPGKSVVITNSAINHSGVAQGNVDLSAADFEVKSANKTYSDSHNSDVAEVKLVSTFGSTDFMNLLGVGPNGILLLAADTKLADCPKTYGKGKTSGNEYTIVPLFKSIDCVDIVKQKTPTTDDKRFAESYDAGFTCTESTETFNAQAVVRKTAFITKEGRTVLYDTNNSTVDFESTTDLTPRKYSDKAYGLTASAQKLVIPESGFVAINAEKPFCASSDVTFCYVNATNNVATTDMTYYAFSGDSLLLIAGPWIAVGKPGTYDLMLSESQGVMKSRSSFMSWSDEDTKTLSQANRMIYKFQSEKGKVGFKRVEAVGGKYNTATFDDNNRLYISVTEAVADKIAAANGATSHSDLEFIEWHGIKPAVTDGIREDVPSTSVRQKVVYSLQGIRLKELQQGINIVNGKKIVVK